jgi:hypothetical protein
MHKNLFWQAFLLLIFTAALSYTAIASYRYYSYSHLTEKTSPLSLVWDIQELSSDKFIIEATYQISVKEKFFSGKTSWKNDFYLNQWATQKAIEENSTRDWIAWYDPLNPSHNSLQKNFPLKECLTAIFLWVLFFYFLGIGYYVAKFKT